MEKWKRKEVRRIFIGPVKQGDIHIKDFSEAMELIAEMDFVTRLKKG